MNNMNEESELIMPASLMMDIPHQEIEMPQVSSTLTYANVPNLSENIYQINISDSDTLHGNGSTHQNLIMEKLFENQKKVISHQGALMAQMGSKLTVQNIIIDKVFEMQKQLLENQTIMMEQIQSLCNIQNVLNQKMDTFFVQQEEAAVSVKSGKNQSELLFDSIHSLKPAKNVEELNQLEETLSDRNKRARLKEIYSVLCARGKGKDCAYMLADILFSRKFICQCSWSGGSRGETAKIAFKNYKHILSFFWEMVNHWDNKYTVMDNDNFFKVILKCAYRRSLSNKRMSTCKLRPRKSAKKLKTTHFDEESVESNECLIKLEPDEREEEDNEDKELEESDSKPEDEEEEESLC